MPDKAIKILEQLVAFDTTSSNPNRACIDFIREYLDGFGIRSTVIADDTDTKACLWASLGPADKAGGIVLAGHSDTVPVEGQKWTSDPFTLTERDGKLYGRGTCDMKGFIACTLAMVPEWSQQNLTSPIHLAFTHDEETDMSGAARLTDYMAKHKIKPEWVWVGEPTELRIIDSHKGVAAFETRLTGVPAHSGKPDLGLNAIEMAVDFMSILRSVDAAKRAHPFAPSRFDPPYTTFNLGTIHGGTAENIVAEHCDLVWQVRSHPGDDLATTLAAIDNKVRQTLTDHFVAFAPHAGIKTCTCFDIPPLMPTKDNPGQEILGRLTGHKETEAVSFATEGGFFQKLGTHVVICGPGSIDQAHKADEFVARDQLTACIDLMRRVTLSSRHS